MDQFDEQENGAGDNGGSSLPGHEELAEKFRREQEEFIGALKDSAPSILVAGPTGAGKSTLINTVMGRDVAKTGTGRPVTQGCDVYEDDLVRFYDTRGYETGSQADGQFNSDVLDFITRCEKGEEPGCPPVDVVWYCVSAGGGRFTEYDATLIRRINQTTGHKPLAVVLTKQDHADDESAAAMIQEVRRYFPEDMAVNMEVFETYDPRQVSGQEARDLDRAIRKGIRDLFRWTSDHLDVSRRVSFELASRRGFEEKARQCDTIISAATAAATGVAASPVPFSDAVLLVPVQIAMLAKITSVWGISGASDALVGTISTLITTSLGRTAAGSLLKLIPGVGTAAGAVINSAVASAVTYALGKAAVTCCRKINEMALEGSPTLETARTIFTSEFLQMALSYFQQKYSGSGK